MVRKIQMVAKPSYRKPVGPPIIGAPPVTRRSRPILGEQSLTLFAKKAGISISYASQILSENDDTRRDPTMDMAVRLYKRTGLRFNMLSFAKDDEIDGIVKCYERYKRANRSARR